MFDFIQKICKMARRTFECNENIDENNIELLKTEDDGTHFQEVVKKRDDNIHNKLNEQTIYGNSFVKIKDSEKVFGEGYYIVGNEIEPGEYYFWGNSLSVDIKGKKARYISCGLEETYDAYGRLCLKNEVLIENGYMTSISNIIYTYQFESMLVPKHMYRVGSEIPQGRYRYEYNENYDFGESYSFLNDGECAFDRFKDEDGDRIYRINGVNGVAETDSLTKYVVILNGRAVLEKEGEFHPDRGPEQEEIRLREYLFREKLEEDKLKKLSDLSKVFVGDYVYYYCSISDPIAEVVLNHYFASIGEIEKIDNFDKKDFSVNYKVGIRKDDIDNQCVLCFMFMKHKIKEPACYGTSYKKILYSYESKIDKEKSKELYLAINSMKKNVSSDVKRTLKFLEKTYPYHVLMLDDYFVQYVPATYFKQYLSEKAPKYLYYYMWEGERNSKYEKIYREIILKLAEKGLISKRWKSEFSLYLLVKSYFPNTEYQYRDQWLEKQSLDIYVPELRVGFEYQGLQHYQPIEIFDGNDGFEKRQFMDELKRKKCKENHVILIEWEYTSEVTDNNLQEVLKKLNIDLPEKKTYSEMSVKEIEKTNKTEREIIYQYDLDGNFINEYENIKKAESDTQIGKVNILRACRGFRSTAGGYQWRRMKFGSPKDNIAPIRIERSSGNARRILQMTSNNEIIERFHSIAEAVKKTGINSKSIRDAANGKQRHAGGFIWEYEDKEAEK